MSGASDPTTTGFRPPSDQPAYLSGNEVETLAMKAARGAGMDWGLAEEAGHAARWLHQRGVNSLTPLTELLDAAQSTGWTAMRPAGLEQLFARKGDCLCPITLGTVLTDMARLPRHGIGAVAQPVLLIPFLGSLAGTLARPITMQVGASQIIVTPQGRLSTDALPSSGIPTLSPSGTAIDQGEKHASPCYPTGTLNRLNAYALETTVPVSDASRADAGSALDDND